MGSKKRKTMPRYCPFNHGSRIDKEGCTHATVVGIGSTSHPSAKVEPMPLLFPVPATAKKRDLLCQLLPLLTPAPPPF